MLSHSVFIVVSLDQDRSMIISKESKGVAFYGFFFLTLRSKVGSGTSKVYHNSRQRSFVKWRSLSVGWR